MHFLGLFTLHYTYVMLHIFTALFSAGRGGGERGAPGLQSLTLLSLLPWELPSVLRAPGCWPRVEGMAAGTGDPARPCPCPHGSSTHTHPAVP